MGHKKKGKNSNYKINFEKQETADKRKNLIILIVGVLVAVLLVGSIVAAIIISSNTPDDDGGDGNSPDTSMFENADPAKTDVMGTGSCDYLETRDISGREIKYVEFCVENYGKFVVLLDATTAPITVENFVSLVEDGFYDGLTFHRIMGNFMIQGGDPKGNGRGGSDKTIVGEFASNGYDNDINHKYGVISMARSDAPNSASSQFFICNADSYSVSALDGDYATFGYVVQGMSVIDEITEDYKHYNGVISDKTKQPVIKYVKVLESWGNS